jgi:hypothetical protein
MKSKLIKILRNPLLLIAHSITDMTRFISNDEIYLKILYYCYMHKKLNLKDPLTYNEKLQWLKLYDRKAIYTQLVDKAAAKDYVAERIGKDYIIPTLGVYDNFAEIDFEKLPDQFVLKTTHDSGGVVICHDKTSFDFENAEIILSKSLKRNFYLEAREWPYKDVKPRIIAEKYMEDETGELRDYKFFCFDGEVKAMFIATDRYKNEETKFDFFDENYNHLPFTNGHPNAAIPPSKPLRFEEMKQLAAKLSKGIPQVRVDFYEIQGKVYFGEMTFFHWSGMVPFKPAQWDYTFGSWIKLPI